MRSESAGQSWFYPPSLHQISRSYGIAATAPTVYCEHVECIWVALQTDCPQKHPNGWFLLCQDFLDQLATIEDHRALDDDPIPRFAVDPAPLDVG